MKGISDEELFHQFSNRAGYHGDLHTADGVKSLYSIVCGPTRLYADCTLVLFEAYKSRYAKRDDGLNYPK